MLKHFQRAHRSRSAAIHYSRSFVIPTATGSLRALAIIGGIYCSANPVNGQLPNTVFDLCQNIIYAHNASMRAQARDRCSVV